MDLTELEKNIGITFTNRGLLETALIHRSYINENRSIKEHNERLEFLGDAVLELIVTHFLYLNYNRPEGELTSWRSALVRGENLAHVARKLKLGTYLYISHGEERSGGRDKDYILANTCEALIGAIYLDKGMDRTSHFVHEHIIELLPQILEQGLHVDPKSLLQEMSQARAEITPEYRMLADEGPDHEKIFTMGAYIRGELVGSGKGSSKQNAEQEAAKDALHKLGWL